jgi:hypothetical protein
VAPYIASNAWRFVSTPSPIQIFLRPHWLFSGICGGLFLILAGALFSFSASSKGPPAPEFAPNFRNARLTQAFLGTINGDRRSTLPRNSPPPPGRFARWRRDGQKQRAPHCRAALIRLAIDPAKYRGTYRYTPGPAAGPGGQIAANGIEDDLQPVAQKMQRDDRGDSYDHGNEAWMQSQDVGIERHCSVAFAGKHPRRRRLSTNG